MLEVIFAVTALGIAAAIVKQAGPESEDSFYDLSDGERQQRLEPGGLPELPGLVPRGAVEL